MKKLKSAIPYYCNSLHKLKGSRGKAKRSLILIKFGFLEFSDGP